MRTLAGLIGLFLVSVTAWADPGTGSIAGSGVEWEARPVRVVLTSSGYKVILSKAGVDDLRAMLDRVGDGKNLSGFIQEMSKIGSLDEESALRLQLTAWAVSSQLPSFKEAMAKNPGPNGAVINVFGVQRQPKKDRPILRNLAKGFIQRLPPELEEKAQKALIIARTDVLFWTVEAR